VKRRLLDAISSRHQCQLRIPPRANALPFILVLRFIRNTPAACAAIRVLHRSYESPSKAVTNRRIHRFNNAIDRIFARPLAIAYDKITPDPVQASIGKFFGNLGEPGTAVNQILQGRPVRALQTLGRFLVNTSVGIGGLFDPATRFGIPQYNEDLGQTFAMWGWRDSRYLVLPLLGPRTARDSVGMVGEQSLSPASYIDDTRTANGLRVLQLTDGRARLLPMDDMRRDAVDEYALVRDVWTQRRIRQIDQDRRPPTD
jgi:phospholipid-binding lipoprotein MlaA